MSPCCYVNDMVTSDIRSLLLIKRKGARGSADEESLASSDIGKSASTDAKSVSSSDGQSAGKKRRTVPDSNTSQPMAFALPQQTSCDSNKRAKTTSVNNHFIKVTDNNVFGLVTKNGPADSLLQSYNMALGEGINHQLNSFMNQNSSNGTVITNAAQSSQNSASTSTSSGIYTTSSTIPLTTNNTNCNSYLAHTSGQHALTVPAPMQFLDPSELGMSIESSLNELKNNFKAASNADQSSLFTQQHVPSYSQGTATNHGSENTNAKQAMLSESKASAYGSDPSMTSAPSKPQAQKMLSRDDSLVNLAMLPTMDYFTSNVYNDNGFLQRNDSLVELAGSVEQTNNFGTAASSVSSGNAANPNGNDGVDSFPFINFPGQM